MHVVEKIINDPQHINVKFIDEHGTTFYKDFFFWDMDANNEQGEFMVFRESAGRFFVNVAGCIYSEPDELKFFNLRDKE